MRGRVDEECIAVRLRPGDGTGTHRLPRAGPVLDHDALSELRGELLEHHARNRVDDAAGRDGHDRFDRLGGPGLCNGIDGREPQAEGERQYHKTQLHEVPAFAIRRTTRQGHFAADEAPTSNT